MAPFFSLKHVRFFFFFMTRNCPFRISKFCNLSPHTISQESIWKFISSHWKLTIIGHIFHHFWLLSEVNKFLTTFRWRWAVQLLVACHIWIFPPFGNNFLGHPVLVLAKMVNHWKYDTDNSGSFPPLFRPGIDPWVGSVHWSKGT